MVKDAQLKQPVDGATVTTGTSTTKTSDAGVFTIEAKPGATITITHVGYAEKKWKVPAKPDELVEILMNSKDDPMEQVVVQSFKTVKKSTMTGASTVISGKDLQDRPVSNVMDLLQGRVAGLNIQNTTGSPGSMATINMRGVSTTNVSSSGNLTPTSPLFIIDGVPVDVNSNYQYGFESGGAGISPVSLIPPEDIESMEFLKDAATTSQYGSKATYGVIVITTKRGQSKVPIIQYSGSYFYTTPPKLRSVIGGQEERRIRLNTILNFDTASRQSSLEYINRSALLSDSLNPYWNNSTDWQSYFYRTTSNHQHNINVSGGDRRFNYKANLNYYNQQGIVVNTGFQRYGLNLVGNYMPSDRFFMSMSLTQQLGYKQNASGVGAYQTGIANTANTSSLYPPPSLFSNSEALASATTKNSGKLNNTTGSLNVQYEPIKGIRFTNLLTYNYSSNASDYFRSQYLAQDSAGLFSYNDRSYNLYNRSAVNFTKIVNDVHNFTAYAFNEITKEGYRAHMIYFNQPADDQIWGPIGNSFTRTAGGTYSNISEGRIHAYGGDFAYNFAEKYIIDLSYRLDNTSTNGPTRGYTKSPAVSGRWNFYKEKLFKNASWLNSGAIRASWGKNIKPNGTIFDVYGKYLNGPRYNNGQTVVIDFETLPNVEFAPEVAATTNIGLDLALFNKLNITADAYYKAIDNQLVESPLSNTNGFQRVALNAQSIVNRGIELAATLQLVQKDDFRWSVSANGAYNEATLAKLPSGTRSIIKYTTDANSSIPVINKLGTIPTTNLLYVNRGVYANTSDVPVNPATGLRLQYGSGQGLFFQAGDPIWVDVNGDYIIDDNDLVPVGNPTPKLTGGFNTQITYKGFTLNVNTSLFAYRDILNLVLANQFANYGKPTDITALIPINGYNYWQPANADRSSGTVGAIYPNPYDFRRASALGPFRANQTLFLENGTYFKLGSVVLAYNIDRNFLRNYGITSCRLSLSGNNLYNFTKYSGVNPEQVSTLGRDISGGYPLAKTYSFSVSIQF
ncbi:SusC/RagA family TonB-linked outer membrane protein [Niabella pedocola]|uniref:SusC/RagA family TonB-linked outer membrane protein n=1 Tax=Niabella pedocola TaxID=1752077 RepID=A0ABS8PUA0_9BACT|nr:SusC/RagA family TonB-linked outer membrane protein [Niabella pedocola]MCD2424659.1 SusC/RagA family TonB-linked outer membrane protein [Niabella pedocola]